MIYICGDVHGQSNDFEKIKRLKNFTQKNDFVVILGDIGALWEDVPTEKEKNILSIYNSFNCPVLWIDGNHENFFRFKQLPTTSMFGGVVGQVSENIFHLRRGEVYTIDNKTFFVMGGAESIDRASRIPLISWWPDELPSKDEYENAKTNLEKVNNKVDYILTHDAPLSFYYEAYNKVIPNELNHFLEMLNNTVEFKMWYFGHHHMDEIIDDKHIVVYNTIRTIE